MPSAQALATQLSDAIAVQVSNAMKNVDKTMYGTVAAVATDGTMTAYFSDATSPQAVIRCCQCIAGDRIVCILTRTGDLLAIAVVGGQCPYAVGDWLTTENATAPSVRWPGTTWVAITDRMPMGASSTYPVGTQGGEATHTLTGNEMPSHTHSLRWNQPDSNGGGGAMGIPYNYTNANVIGYDYSPVSFMGNSAAHNNLPPYRAAYIWRRTA